MNPYELTTIGRYEVRRFVAEGGMAWVFEVVDPRFSGHDVVRALKLLKPEAAAGEEFERFRDEASLLAGFNHPSLVTIFDFDRDEEIGLHYYTMTFVDGPNLAELVEENGPLTPKRAVEVFSDVLAGLAELHNHPKQIVHRDIKPSNVLTTTREGRAILADLGIARVGGASRLTRTGYAVGTALYMSPEQARGRDVAPTSDVFSVGFTLYEALAARNVYTAVEGVDSTSEYDVLGYLAACGRSGSEIEIDFSSSPIPDDICDVIRKACRYDPADRYPDASEMRQDLIAAGEHAEDVVARKKTGRRTAVRRRKAKRRKAAAAHPWRGRAIAAGVTLAIALFATWGVFQWMDRGQALASIQDAEELRATVTELKVGMQALDTGLTPKLRTALDDGSRVAQEKLETAHSHFEDRYWGAAERSAKEAILSLETPCRDLSAELGAGVDEMAAEVAKRQETLRSFGAPEFLPTDWAAFNAEIAAIPEAVPATGCASILSEMQRRARVLATITSAGILNRALELHIPDAISSLRARVDQARTLARAETVSHDAYTARIASAGEASRKAETALAGGDHRTAYVALSEAHQAYQEAEQLVPAAMAQLEVRGLERQLQTLRVSPPDNVSLLVSSADSRFQAAEYPGATDSYLEAAEKLVAVIDDAQRQAEARKAEQQVADKARRDLELEAERTREAELAENRAKLEALAERREDARKREAERQAEEDRLAAAQREQELARQRERERRADAEKRREDEIRIALAREAEKPKNRAPSLALTPAFSDASVGVGEPYKVSARVTDPEKSSVKVVFELDGKVVSEQPGTASGGTASYTFNPTAPGAHKLRVYASDGELRSAPNEISIRVEGGWQSELHQAMARYEAALNHRSISELRNVWPYVERSEDLPRIQMLFRNADLEVKVDVHKVSRDPSDEALATVTFSQADSFRQRTREKNKLARLRRRGSGDWQIEQIATE